MIIDEGFKEIEIPNNDVDIKYLVKSNMMVKLIQIPAYIVIFIIGIICLFTIFTFGLSLALVLLDFAALFMSGIYAVTCYKKLENKNIISRKEFIIYSLLSFVYCADVVVSIMAYKHVILFNEKGGKCADGKELCGKKI